jgi:hypothetical protein
MRHAEMKTVGPASVFVLLFSAGFIIALIYCLGVNLEMIPRVRPELFHRLQAKIEALRPVPKALACALVVGLVAGVGGTILALLYNIFSNIFGGFKYEVKE